MTLVALAVRSLRHYRATNAAVAGGVAVAVAVLTGALLVGDSVRASLRQLVDERLGHASLIVTTPTSFRQQLADDLGARPGFSQHFGGVAPLIAIEGAMVHERSGRQATRVQIYGIDDRFFPFHGVSTVATPTGRDALVSPALATELQTAAGDALLLKMPKPSAIPATSIQGRRDETTRAVRVTVRDVLDAGHLGEFSLRAQQDAVRAVFVPIARLQRDLALSGRANLLLVASAPGQDPTTAQIDQLLAESAQFEDLGLKLVPAVAQHAWSLESDAGVLSDSVRATAETQAWRLGFHTVPVLTYLANTLRVGNREIPYSVVSGLDPRIYERAPETRPPDVLRPFVDRPADPSPSLAATPHPPLWLNAWAAQDLDAKMGDEVMLEYYRWSDEAGLATERARFTFVGSVPMSGVGGDRTLTPEYPGLTTASHIADWDPPFPVDLTRIRPKDEAYWEQYRTAPKALVDPPTARKLWASPYGSATSLRIYVPTRIDMAVARDAITTAIRRNYTPATGGVTAQAIRSQALAASQGATDFGEYFVYFSFFIVVSAVLLTALFFKLGLEQRARQIGLLFALGYTARHIRRLLLIEAGVLAVTGSAAGLVGAVLFGELILYGLRTWWVDAVGTTRLALAVSPTTLIAGATLGLVVALAALLVTLRRLGAASPRDLLSGLALMVTPRKPGVGRRRRAGITLGLGLLVAGALAAAGARRIIGNTPAFFGAGAVLLLASLWALSQRLRSEAGRRVEGRGWRPVAALGTRQARAHPGRSVLSVALIACATFVIVAVGAFRHGAPEDPHDRHSGTGGYALFAESAAPILYDPGTAGGRRSLTLDDGTLRDVRIERFRLRPGDDGSCLNLYKPASPRLIAPTSRFVEAGGFRFAASLAASDRERQNPWRLLERRFPDGAVPAIGDANSLQYVLHVGMGDDLLVPGPGGQPILLRIVAALSDSVFQSELIIPERQFTELFPRLEGYRFFMLAPPPGREQAAATALENGLADFGFDVQSTADRLATYHRVENTYLSTFQALGAFGLLLGTLGLGAILLRNVLERQRELALLQAVGFTRLALGMMVIAESALLLVAGIGIGTLSSAVAVLPAFTGRGTPVPIASTILMLAIVLAGGLLSSLAATRVAAASPLLSSLKAE
jgi:putative ABC transport system permease protein